jgi:hypothetical protein
MRATLDSVARLAGHDRPAAAQVNVDVSINVSTVVQQLIAAIGPSPSHRQIKKLAELVDAD